MDVLDILSSEEACSGLFGMVRWRSGVHCPRCGSVRVKGRELRAGAQALPLQGLRRNLQR
ncbi:MAG: transposase [Candidatus Freyarchaeota archaeon]